MKKYSAIVIIVLSLISYNMILAEDIEPKELVKLANIEITNMELYSSDYFDLKNIEGKELIQSKYLENTRNYIVYGNHHGDFKMTDIVIWDG